MNSEQSIAASPAAPGARPEAYRARGAVALGAIASVLAEYFDGLYFSDAERLRTVFHPDAVYACVSDGRLTHHTMDAYLPIVAAREAPAARGEPRHDEVIWIELVGPVTAVARVRCAIGPRRFDDILSWIHTNDRWQIIAKVFHSEPTSERS